MSGENSKYSLYSLDINPFKNKILLEYLIGGNCLDIGCGSGAYSEAILSKCNHLVQIDVTDRRLPRFDKTEFISMDANDLNFPMGSFNNIVAFDVMEHLKDDELFIANVKKICTGRLILSVPNADDSQLRKIGLTYLHHIDKTHLREYTREGLIQLLESRGFRVISMMPQYTNGLLLSPLALAGNGYLSKLAAHMICLVILIFTHIGLFKNNAIADWFCIAEVDR